VPVVALVWCALLWRARSQARPETFAAILAAAVLLLLEARRAALRDGRPSRHAWGLVPVAVAWANAHISYYLGFVLAGAHLLDDLLRRRAAARGLAIAMGVAALAGFVNPFGWRALAQPFEYFLSGRHEPIFSTIGELQPIDWSQALANGLPAFLALLVAGAVAHARRHGPDWAQLAIYLVCLPQAFASQRFVGYLAVCAAPYFARDMGELAAAVRWPAWLAAPWRRAALAATACVALVTPDLSRAPVQVGYGFVWNQYPVRACDWIEAHDVRGRGFNPFSYGGYLLWRFYPDSTRLPFMDIHQAGTREIRYLYAWALQDPAAWRELDRRYRFDWVLLPRVLAREPDLADFLDADTTWALAFADDAAALWLRRDGSCAPQARAHAYRWMPGGTVALGALGAAAGRDPLVRAGAAAEFARAMASSPFNARAHTLGGNLDMIEGDFASARAHYDEAARQQPNEPELKPRQGLARLHAGDPAAALECFREMRRLRPRWPEADLREAQALMALGRRDEALRLVRRSVERHPEMGEARDSLERWGGR
jgi:tetratricopeptide (TPR) repeat protein